MEQEHDPRLSNPTIRILFDGLFFLCFDTEKNPSNECQIGALTTASDHELSVTIVESVEAEDENYIYSHKTFSLHPSMSRYIGHVRLNVRSGSRRIDGVERYEYGNGEPIPRGRQEDYPANFKWIIDFENGEFHDQELDIADGVFSPVLHVNTGLFYSHELSTGKTYDLVKADVAKSYFGYVARTMAANIELEEDDEVVFERREGDYWVPLMPLYRDPDATYLIHLQNVCPKCKTTVEDTVKLARNLRETDALEVFEKHLYERAERLKEDDPKPIPPDGRSDFRYYYDAIRNYSGVERFDFELRDERGASPSVCYPTSGSQSRELP